MCGFDGREGLERFRAALDLADAGPHAPAETDERVGNPSDRKYYRRELAH